MAVNKHEETLAIEALQSVEEVRHRKLATALALSPLVIAAAGGVIAERTTEQPAARECIVQACGQATLGDIYKDALELPRPHISPKHPHPKPTSVPDIKKSADPSPSPAAKPQAVVTPKPRLPHAAHRPASPFRRGPKGRAALRLEAAAPALRSEQPRDIIDVSFPQCQPHHKELVQDNLPAAQGKVIVGVNNGRPSDTNTCLPGLLGWTERAGSTELYVNTSNPGVTNPKAYGWSVAQADMEERFVPAAKAAGVSTDPTDYGTVWLDVEGANSWRYGSARAQLSNERVLEGMAAYFKHIGMKVGIYSVNGPGSFSLFHHIVGEVPAGSNLNGLPSWLAQANGYSGALEACDYEPLTPSSEVVMTQYVKNGIDYDHPCA